MMASLIGLARPDLEIAAILREQIEHKHLSCLRLAAGFQNSTSQPKPAIAASASTAAK
jgi:hypothetical protein